MRGFLFDFAPDLRGFLGFLSGDASIKLTVDSSASIPERDLSEIV